MILNIQKFIEQGRPHWTSLETILEKLESDTGFQMNLIQIGEFHALYRRASTDLSEISTFASEQEIRQYLESLVARAYGEIHETREKPHRFHPHLWFFHTLPQTFRRHFKAFTLTVGITLLGMAFGGGAISLDPEAKDVLMPFSHLQGDPNQRVTKEEKEQGEHINDAKMMFASYLMTHNTKVSILTLAMGMTYGAGTLLLLFYNGVILGAVSLDYALAGQTTFLLGWLMPHGVIEIPSILVAGQAGLILGSAMIGWGSRKPLRHRLREVSADIVTLITGVAILLIWAGIIEAFFSQYHEPLIPYSIKIAFGIIELILLIAFLGWSGKNKATRILD